MSKRKGWSDLSAVYRGRLERKGITREAYESGTSLSSARGHANTPERPSDAYNRGGRQRFRQYLDKAGSLRNQIIERKVILFANHFKYNAERSRKYVLEGGSEVTKPGVVVLRKALKMTDDEIIATLSTPNMDEKWRFLWYH